jgi:hypothetical protein
VPTSHNEAMLWMVKSLEAAYLAEASDRRVA